MAGSPGWPPTDGQTRPGLQPPPVPDCPVSSCGAWWRSLSGCSGSSVWPSQRRRFSQREGSSEGVSSVGGTGTQLAVEGSRGVTPAQGSGRWRGASNAALRSPDLSFRFCGTGQVSDQTRDLIKEPLIDPSVRQWVQEEAGWQEPRPDATGVRSEQNEGRGSPPHHGQPRPLRSATCAHIYHPPQGSVSTEPWLWGQR